MIQFRIPLQLLQLFIVFAETTVAFTTMVTNEEGADAAASKK